MEIKKQKTKRNLIIACTAALVLIGVTTYFILDRGSAVEPRDEAGVSLERTAQDKKLEAALEKDPSKKVEGNQSDSPESPSVNPDTKLQNVNAVLTSVGEAEGIVSASGFISNVVEVNGDCTFIFTKGLDTVSAKSNTLTNPNSTTCATVNLTKDQLEEGTWDVYLKYASSTSAGQSNHMELIVK